MSLLEFKIIVLFIYLKYFTFIIKEKKIYYKNKIKRNNK